MTGVTPTPDRDAVLAAINDLRGELDLPPLDAIPRGMPGSSMECPVAQALRCGDSWADVYGGYWTMNRGLEIEKVGETPAILTAFIDAFDDERYPDLIEGRAS